MKDIRHISVSRGNRIAVAEFEARVQIFDISSQSVVSEFNTILDFGGKRIALSPNGKVCVCGCWKRHGVAAYDAESGQVIWQRKDLKKPQEMHFLNQGSGLLFIRFAIGASRIVDITTGVDSKKLSSIHYLWDNPFQPIDVHQKSKDFVVVDRPTQRILARVPRQTFATLSTAFATSSFAISESGGPLSCYDSIDGRLLWKIDLGMDGHFLEVLFNPSLERYLGITWPFMKGGPKKVKVMNPYNGSIEREVEIGCPTETEFALNGAKLITSDRKIIDTQTFETVQWG